MVALVQAVHLELAVRMAQVVLLELQVLLEQLEQVAKLYIQQLLDSGCLLKVILV
jgi:hypothetical protein